MFAFYKYLFVYLFHSINFIWEDVGVGACTRSTLNNVIFAHGSFCMTLYFSINKFVLHTDPLFLHTALGKTNPRNG